jgi:hypothetical protein
MAKHKSKVQSKGELDLSIGTKANTSFDRRGHRPKCRTTGKRQWYAWLELSGRRSERRTQGGRRRRKIGQIENVEDLGAKLQAPRFLERESPIQDQIDLTELWPTQKVSRQIAECSGLRNCEGRRIED